MKPEAVEHEESGERPSKELITKFGQPGIEINAMRIGPGKHLHGRKLLGGVKGEEFDYFHEYVAGLLAETTCEFLFAGSSWRKRSGVSVLVGTMTVSVQVKEARCIGKQGLMVFKQECGSALLL